MKRVKKSLVLLIVFMLSVSFTLTSCGGGAQGGAKVLKISVQLGEYGQRWINTLAGEFQTETGIQVEVDADPNLAGEIANRLENGSDSDIFFSHGIAWESAAAKGQLAKLNDVYAQEVEDGVTLEDRVLPEFLASSKFNNNYYKLPYVNGTGGLVYNKKMFDDNGWTVPTMFSNPENPTADVAEGAVGLVELCEVMLKADITPFVWSSQTYYWDYVLFDWWVQLAGIDAIEEYKALESVEVFNPTSPVLQAKKQALSAWNDLIAKIPENSMEDSVGKQYTAAQLSFANGDAAMMPNAQWVNQGLQGNIEEDICEVALMKTPFMENAKVDENGEFIDVSFAVGSQASGESIVVPEYADVDLAKQFILFIAKEENLLTFFEETNGAMLAMDYSGITLPEDASQFMRDVWSINTESQKYNLLSTSLVAIKGEVALDWPINGVQPYSVLATKAGGATAEDIDKIFADAYESAKTEWDSWL